MVGLSYLSNNIYSHHQQKTHFRFKSTHKLKVKIDVEKDTMGYSNKQKRPWWLCLPETKYTLSQKLSLEKKEHYIMLNGSIQHKK